ncbi:MAG: helical backbone metal receptor [Kiritimatiellae bacterium]|nr:helical backbone metal receptor [Kiritimatiellia bacterium]
MNALKFANTDPPLSKAKLHRNDVSSRLKASFTLAFAVAVVLLPVARGEVTGSAPTRAERIVSMAPSITEVLYALGLGEKVVGVTRYCRYPPEAANKPKVGAYLDPNYEAILVLKPDLVILLKGSGDTVERLKQLQIDSLVVDHGSIEGILLSLRQIGEKCGVPDKATELEATMRRQLGEIRKKVEKCSRPRVLISAGRTLGTGSLQEIYVPGPGNFYDQVIQLAGGTNAYSGPVPYPVVSAEGVLQMNPDVIIEVAPDLEARRLDRKAILAEWQQLSGVTAVKKGCIYIFEEDFAAIPGPRILRLADKMARILHPEAFVDTSASQIGSVP